MKQFLETIFGPKTSELLDRYTHLRTAMTYAGLVNDSGQLPVEHARRFVNEMLGINQDYEDFLAAVNMMPLNATGTTLDDWELSEVGDIRKHTESTAPTQKVTETHVPRTLTPIIIDLYAPLSYERVGRWLRSAQGEGATKKSGVDLILRELQMKFRRELQNLWINGDTDSTSAHLAIQDGWLKLGLVSATDANLNATAWAGTPDIKAMLMRLRRRATQVRHGELLKLPNFAFIMSEYAHDVFVESLASTASDSAFSLYKVDPKTGMPRYKGVTIYTPNYWPDDIIFMTHLKNLACGVSDEISRDIPLIEYVKDPKAAVHEFVGRVSGACNIAKPSIVLAEYDSNNTDYVAWDAT